MPKKDTFTKNLWSALKQFLQEDGVDKASILAYYSIFSSLFLLTFATFLFTKYFGNPSNTIKSMYPFSPEFFSTISPEIFQKAAEISSRLKEISIIGIAIFMFLGFLIVKKVVQFINEMFHEHLRYKGFLVRRMSEFGLVMFVGILGILSFLSHGFISTLTSIVNKNKFLASHIKPEFISSLNTFFILYIAPIALTFFFFAILYKWIPEKKVYTKGALIAAGFSTILWELIKRSYTYYLINVSAFGQIKGPVIAIILFGFWMEISLGVMLYGAKLTYILDKQHYEKIKPDSQPASG